MDNYARYFISKISAKLIDSIFLYNLHSPKKSIVLFPQKQYFDNLYNFIFLILVMTRCTQNEPHHFRCGSGFCLVGLEDSADSQYLSIACVRYNNTCFPI